MKTDPELLKTFSITKDDNVILMDFFEAESNPDDNGRQAELVVAEIVKTVNKDLSKTYNFLVDMTKVGTIHHISDKARDAYLHLANLRILRKAAIVGRGLFLEVTLNLILQSVGRASSFKIFNDREAAKTWLKE